MGSSGSKIAGRAAETGAGTVKRQLGATPSTYIPSNNPVLAARTQQQTASDSDYSMKIAEQQKIDGDEQKEHQKMVDAFHQLHATVDKRAIPTIGYSKHNEMLNILHKRQSSDAVNRLSEQAREKIRQEQKEHKASIMSIYRMLKTRHSGASNVPWNTDQARADLGWRNGSGSEEIQAMIKYYNTAEPIMLAGEGSEVVEAVWVESKY
ncbi:hypothetical protein O5D80_005240 [Batrachochytrium dendrobatidis]|nr:hypothetical protein O5D80_005240 [Batrachochytrium dendrobatidis]